MLKAILTSIILPGMAMLIAMPATTSAESYPRAGSHIKRPSAHQARRNQRHYRQHRDDQRHQRHARHIRRHRYASDYHWQHHRQHHWNHHRRHRHDDMHIGVNIGGYPYYPPYPHGHLRHIHDHFCPVVVRPVIVAPVWEVYYHSHYRPSAAAIINIVIGPFSGSLYIDDQYYGETHQFHDGSLEFPVSPGLHTVQLRSDGRTYSQKVHAKPGATAVVKANKM